MPEQKTTPTQLSPVGKVSVLGGREGSPDPTETLDPVHLNVQIESVIDQDIVNMAQSTRDKRGNPQGRIDEGLSQRVGNYLAD